MPPQSPSFFTGVPVTKVLVGVILLMSLLHRVRVALPLAFDHTGDLVVGLSLLTLLSRQTEREMGSQRFLGLLGTVLCVAYGAALLSGLSFPNGPYPFLGSLAYYYHFYYPRLYPRLIGVLGWNLSEKALFYLWIMQVVWSLGFVTLGASALGVLTALVYDKANVTIPIPSTVVRKVSYYSDRFIEAPPRVHVTNTIMPNVGIHARPDVAAAAAIPRPAHPVFGQAAPVDHQPREVRQRTPVADPEAIEQLLNMGFERSQVVEALQFANNDVNRAADRLLSQMD